MPRHYFHFSESVKQAVREYVENAIREIDPRRYGQEHHYTAAVAGRLDGIAYQGDEGIIEFHPTVFDDRGPRSAESLFGADFSITAKIESAAQVVEKAIILQSKRGPISQLPDSEQQRLIDQLRKMQGITRGPKVFEIDTQTGSLPKVISGRGFIEGRHYQQPTFPEYIVSKVLTTLDGDTRRYFVKAVEDSALTSLRIAAYKK